MESLRVILDDLDVPTKLRETLDELKFRSNGKIRNSFPSGHDFAHAVDELASKKGKPKLTTIELSMLIMVWDAAK